jgi:glycerol dehydrogenase-like iron-containing ADH family enzyme
MKQITLHTAALDNSGLRHGAGAVLTVGGGQDQLAADAAKELVARGMAAPVASVPTATGPESTSAAKKP